MDQPPGAEDVCYVTIKFKNQPDADRMASDPDLLAEYIEYISGHKPLADELGISDLDLTKVDVNIKCPDKASAEGLAKKLKLVVGRSEHEVLVESPPSKTLVASAVEHVRSRSRRLLEEHDVKIDELLSKLEETKKTGKFCELKEFQKKKLLQETLEEKLTELETQRMEFLLSCDLIGRSLEHYRNNNIRADKEIKNFKKSFQREERRLQAALPIYAHKSKIVESVMMNQVVILLGETGSGKTTQIIQYLHEAWSHSDSVVVCTQPRKVAAVAVATRVAEEMDVKVGELVGYQVGMSSKRSEDTRLLFVTDHMLLNECQKDSTFGKYSCIIFDEAHERSIYTDLLLGFIKRSLMERPDLRVVVTSATIDPKVFVRFFKWFDPPVLMVSGRVFPVEVFYEPSQDGYLAGACEKAASLHRSRSLPGDILVFLVSPTEIARAIKMLSGKNLKDVLIVPLHGQLEVAQQREALAPTPANKRKVVFATNVAETSVTIPGVRYVVDSGRVKEVTFDGAKNMTSLVETNATQSSAEQRKGRAGRTESGECYRLYSMEEFVEMRPQSVPEILRTNLGQSMLKLMMLGVKNPKHFDFVEAPPAVTMKMAMDQLTELGAIDINGITQVGKKLAVINLEPRLGKFALLGIDEGLGYESVVMCALSSSGNQIFFRGGTDDNKILSDFKKTPFCSDFGDMITLLNVYKKWSEIPRKDQVKWCLENSINSKRVFGAREAVAEILHSFLSELRVHIQERFSDDVDAEERLCKNIFRCFGGNLALNTGHRRLGFRVMTDPASPIFVHPSSAFNYLEDLPAYVVFQSLFTTSERFMLNSTLVKKSWIEEAVGRGELTFSQRVVDEIVLKKKELPKVGSRIQNLLMSKKSAVNKSDIETMVVASSHRRVIAFLDSDRFPKLFLYASAHFVNEAYRIALKTIEGMKEELLKEVIVKTISPMSSIKFSMIRGMEVTSLLTRNEFVQVLMGTNLRTNIGSVEREFGEKLIFWRRLKDDDSFVFTFADPTSAGRCLATFGGKAVEGCSFTRQHPTDDSDNFCVKVNMLRRRAKPISYLKFKDHATAVDFILKCNSMLQLGDRVVGVKFNKKEAAGAMLVGTPEWATRNLIIDGASRIVSREDINGVVIPREPPPSEENSRWQVEDFKEILCRTLSRDETGINVRQPHEQQIMLTAFINFTEFLDAQAAVEKIMKFESMTASLDFKLHFYTPAVAYDKLHTTIAGKLKEIERNSSRKVKIKTIPPKETDFLTIVETENFEDYALAQREISPLLRGIAWSTEHFVVFKNEKRILSDVSMDCNTFIRFNDRDKSLQIFGSRSSIENTIARLQEVGARRDISKWREVLLRNSKYPNGTMRKLILDFGCDVENSLRESCNAEEVRVLINRHIIKLKGTEEAFKNFQRILDATAASIETGDNVAAAAGELGNCPICLEGVERDNYFLSESCGHIYCNSCAKQLMKSNVRQKVIPMKCIVEGCDKAFNVSDIKNLVPSREDFLQIQRVAIRVLQARNPDSYFFCPTPGCPSIFPKMRERSEPRPLHLALILSVNSEKLTCCECGVSVCRSCGGKGHLSVICPSSGALTPQEISDFQSYQAKDPQNRSNCPKCSFGIEKNGGCSHVECAACKTHICWSCKKTFETSGGCYVHMRLDHEGY